MRYDLREIRLSGLAEAITFAKGLGGEIEAGQVRHTLSIDIHEAGERVAVALCLETRPGQHTIHLGLSEEADAEALGQIATDTILRKMQAAGVGVSRLQTKNEDTAERLWSQTNWLDRIPGGEAAAPPQDDADASEAQAPDAADGANEAATQAA